VQQHAETFFAAAWSIVNPLNARINRLRVITISRQATWGSRAW